MGIIKTVKKIKDLEGYKQPVAVYELSEALSVDDKVSNFVVGGISKNPPFKDRVAMFLSNEKGELLFFLPVMDFEVNSVSEAFKTDSYTLVD